MKYAFVANIEGVTPETYSAVFETAGCYNLIAGVDGMDAAKEYIGTLADEGYDMIELCGDFTDEITEEIREIVGEGIEINNARYTIDEAVKMEFTDSLKNYGVIIMDEDVDKYHEIVLKSESCDMRVMFVQDMRQAKNAAKRMVEKKIDFIELCGWFDILRLGTMVEVTENKVPIGTCGELNPTKIK